MKRHIAQDDKQRKGQYFTTNASTLLTGYEYIVRNAKVVEPFAGGGDLVEWCYTHGAQGVKSYDINPINETVILNDSILDPWFEGCDTIVTNPPYLSRNKNKDKVPYDQWGQSDLYKCHLAALVSSDIERGVLILPSNFISESSSKIRDLFFSRFKMNTVKYYRYPVFDDATTGICVFDFKRWTPQPTMYVDFEIHYPTGIQKETHLLKREYGWLVGKDFFEYIYEDNSPYDIKILRNSYPTLREFAGSSIMIGLLTNGKYPLGAHYNDGKTFYASEKTFTTYQVGLPVFLTENEQRNVVDMYNEKLGYYMDMYEGLFLANYMGATQKIKSRTYSNLLLSRCIKETKKTPLNRGLTRFF